MIPVLVFYYNPESSESSDTFQVQVSDQRETPRKSLFGYVFPCRTGDDKVNWMEATVPKSGSFQYCKVSIKFNAASEVSLENTGLNQL
jgi:hypothetical protein